jgi:hypothetical protein
MRLSKPLIQQPTVPHLVCQNPGQTGVSMILCIFPYLDIENESASIPIGTSWWLNSWEKESRKLDKVTVYYALARYFTALSIDQIREQKAFLFG